MTKLHWAWVIMLGPILLGFLTAIFLLNPFLILIGLAGTLFVQQIARELSYEYYKDQEEKKDAN